MAESWSSLIFWSLFSVSLLYNEQFARALQQPHPPPHIPSLHQHLGTAHSDALRRSQTLSVAIDPARPRLSSFIRLLNSPAYFTNGYRLQVEYACQAGDLVAVQLYLRSDDLVRSPIRVFHYDWTCSEHSRGTRQTFVALTVPDWLAYRPDNWQPDAINADGFEMKTWIVSSKEKDLCIRWNRRHCYKRAHVKGLYSFMMPSPYRRPRKDYEKDQCLSWLAVFVMNYLSESDYLVCFPEDEVVQLVDFPVALTQSNSGITKELLPFNDVSLHNQLVRNQLHPRFTISTMIYILEYCSANLCGIFHRKSSTTNDYATPLLFLTRKGQVHVQVVLEDGQSSGRLTHYKIPLRRWVHLFYRQDGSKWSLYISNEENYDKITESGSVFPKPVFYDEMEGLSHLGGSNVCKAFPGFIADTWLWRTSAIKQIPKLNFSTPVLLKKISKYYTRCDDLQQTMFGVYKMYQGQLSALKTDRTCPNSVSSRLGFQSPPSAETRPDVCRPWEERPPRRYRQLWKMLRALAFKGLPYRKNLASTGKRLHKIAIKHLDNRGLASTQLVASLLRQASCYGNDESSYMLGTFYSGGLNVEPNQDEAYLHWLVAAQSGNRLAMLALGDHHFQGLNSAPQDFDFSYNYLKHLADLTVKDRERHDPDGVLTEFVRLTDPSMLQVHKGEDGDHFRWLKYQAKKGIASAQLDLARILFWGQRGVERDIQRAVELYRLYLMQIPDDEIAHYDYGIITLKSSVARLKFWGSEGVKRDMKTAVKYYAKSAKEMPKNKIALYDYGIVLLRGQGTEKNVEKALDHLNRSAELGHAPAYTALGWYAINFQKDMANAAKYFDKADRMGHRDAMHNLGYMYKVGRYPGKPADQTKALHYFQKAADRGHIDSAGVVADFYNQGNEGVMRDSYKAAFWSRLVCEQNPGIGMALRKGLDAYLDGSWGLSVVYYMMVAETGTEVAQFNLAHLCEEDHDSQVSTFVRSDCVWKYYNLSSHAYTPHVLSQLKMGDFHYYGKHGEKAIPSAVEYYAMAAKQNDPQALFNLAYLLEEGVAIENTVWKSIRIPKRVYESQDKADLAVALYTRCRDAGNKDSYFPCGLALVRVQAMSLWSKHTLAIQVSSALMLGFLMLICITSCLQRRPCPDTSPPQSSSPAPSASDPSASDPSSTDSPSQSQSSGV